MEVTASVSSWLYLYGGAACAAASVEYISAYVRVLSECE